MKQHNATQTRSKVTETRREWVISFTVNAFETDKSTKKEPKEGISQDLTKWGEQSDKWSEISIGMQKNNQ